MRSCASSGYTCTCRLGITTYGRSGIWKKRYGRGLLRVKLEMLLDIGNPRMGIKAAGKRYVRPENKPE